MQRGLYFEEFEVGARYLHRPGRTATEADNVLFSSLTMNAQALHLDAAYSATQPFGQRLMNSMWTLATMVGASVAQLTQGTLVAQLGPQRHRVPARRCSTATRCTPRPRSSRSGCRRRARGRGS